MAVLAAAQAMAQQGVNSQVLERAFWLCDYATTQTALGSSAAGDCSVIFEALKAHRFGGDFVAMMAWWRENKDAKYLTLSNATAQRLTSASGR